MLLNTGTKLHNGQYELIRPSSRRIFAEVWSARDCVGNEIAVKTLGRVFDDDLFQPFKSDKIFQLRHERDVLSRLSHPGIPRFLDYFEEEGIPFIVMNLIDGASLGGVRDILDLKKVWNRIVPILEYVHASGIVHSDISPGNLMVTKKGEIVLIDFGISDTPMNGKRVYPDYTWGTKEFMSPEQVKTPKQVDYRSDYYSLARTFVYLLSGHSPQQNGWAAGSGGLSDYDTAPDVVFREDVCNCAENLDGCPKDWQEFLKPYLAKNPGDRPHLRMITK